MTAPAPAATVSERLAGVRRRIAAAGRDPGTVTVVAVTKGFGPDAVRAALDAGVADIGENYAQELLAKATEVTGAGAAAARWHFLGAVQRNKVAALAPHVALWQGVDRTAAGEEIARRAPGAHVLVQVNVDGGPGRNGCTVAAAPALVAALRRLDLAVDGLMAVASPDSDSARRQFRELTALRADLGLTELSMGMTADLEAAVEAGATMVRIGRALFGARPEPQEMRRWGRTGG
jgi:pyridoxal phosphate enzyme (YggS family)